MTVCGATTRKGSACQAKAGWGTPHPGQGRCKLHGGATPVKHARYSKITRPRIKELLVEQQNELEDPTDLLPEIRMLRALVQDYIERYDEFTEALIAWHNSFTPEYQEAAREAFALAAESGNPPERPDPVEYGGKPRQIIDILAVGKFIGEIGGLIDKIQKAKEKGSITLDTLTRVTSAMALDVERAASRHVKDESIRTALLAEIEQRWDAIGLEPGPSLARDEEA